METETQFSNNSGIYPVGRRILVRPDEIAETITESGIVLPDSEKEKHQQAQSTGVLAAVGGDYCIHAVEDVHTLVNGELKRTEMRVERFAERFAEPGDRIAFAKHGGKVVIGTDGVEYRLLNDTDITTRVDEGVEFRAFEPRKAVGLRHG